MSAALEMRNRRVLGKAVHERAIQRLHELCPEAKVYVQHFILTRVGDTRAGSTLRPTTRVQIETGWPDPCAVAVGNARCAEGDTYNRKVGIQIAFRRALDLIREEAQRRNG